LESTYVYGSLAVGCGFPDAFFRSRESGIRKCHSRDSRAPGNGVYCSIISANGAL